MSVKISASSDSLSGYLSVGATNAANFSAGVGAGVIIRVNWIAFGN